MDGNGYRDTRHVQLAGQRTLDPSMLVRAQGQLSPALHPFLMGPAPDCRGRIEGPSQGNGHMSSTMSVKAGRWFHRCGLVVFSLLAWACNTEGPVAPRSPAGPSVPSSPAPTPVVPGAPASARLILSRPDVVFNAAVAATRPDSAAITVSATASSTVTELRTATRYAAGEPAGWLTAVLDRSTLPATLTLSTGHTAVASR